MPNVIPITILVIIQMEVFNITNTIKQPSKKNKTWYDIYSLKNLPNDHYLAPTLQMAMKWLREVHRLDMDISIEYTTEKVYYYSILKRTAIRDIDCLHSETNFESYEEAAKAAIKYCLENLIGKDLK